MMACDLFSRTLFSPISSSRSDSGVIGSLTFLWIFIMKDPWDSLECGEGFYQLLMETAPVVILFIRLTIPIRI